MELDPVTGRELWRADADDDTLLATPAGAALILSAESRLSVRDRGTGRERWAVTTPGLPVSHAFDELAPPLAGKTAVYAWCGEELLAYDLADGAELWRLSAPLTRPKGYGTDSGDHGLYNLAGQLGFVGAYTMTGYR